MALLNYKKKEINAKIVYYGPGLSGKTTNIQHIHTKLRPEHRGKLMTLATQTDRTLFFDFLPVELGEIRGLKTRFQIYTVPGQVFYNATRKLVLKNVDGVVFVADSDPAHLADNLESLRNLEQNLQHHGKNIRTLPVIIQYNKRDLPNAMPIEELEAKLNSFGLPYTEASAGLGKGVLDTLTRISKLVLQSLRDTQNITKIEEAAGKAGVNAPDPGMLESDAALESPIAADDDELEMEVELEDPDAETALEIEEELDEGEQENVLLGAEDRTAPPTLELKGIVESKVTGPTTLELTLAFLTPSGEQEVTLQVDLRALAPR